MTRVSHFGFGHKKMLLVVLFVFLLTKLFETVSGTQTLTDKSNILDQAGRILEDQLLKQIEEAIESFCDCVPRTTVVFESSHVDDFTRMVPEQRLGELLHEYNTCARHFELVKILDSDHLKIIIQRKHTVGKRHFFFQDTPLPCGWIGPESENLREKENDIVWKGSIFMDQAKPIRVKEEEKPFVAKLFKVANGEKSEEPQKESLDEFMKKYTTLSWINVWIKEGLYKYKPYFSQDETQEEETKQ